MPAQGLISVTVTADSAMEADALSTGAFILGPKRGAELLHREPPESQSFFNN